jgi:hypothetical protein
MPGLDMMLDPVTRDYVDDGAGGFTKTDTIATMLYHQLNVHRNEWIADPGLGHTAHLIPPKSSDVNALRYKQAYRLALQEFVDLGLAADLVLEMERDSRTGRIAVHSSIRDVQRGDINLQGILPFAPGS